MSILTGKSQPSKADPIDVRTQVPHDRPIPSRFGVVFDPALDGEAADEAAIGRGLAATAREEFAYLAYRHGLMRRDLRRATLVWRLLGTICFDTAESGNRVWTVADLVETLASTPESVRDRLSQLRQLGYLVPVGDQAGGPAVFQIAIPDAEGQGVAV